MDPTAIAQLLMALGQGNMQGPQAEELMRMFSPEDVTRMIQGTFQLPQGVGGADLGTALASSTAGQAGVGPQQTLYPPLNPPPDNPLLPPPSRPRPPPTTPPPGNRFPQVRMPEATRPIFSGGVTGSQKAPEPQAPKGLSPAMALLQAILGPRGGGGGGGGRAQGGQGLSTLGALLSGQS